MLPPVETAPVWVASLASLVNMVNRISAEPRIAVDTESNSLFAYHEKVCLIQFSTPSEDYLVDPLAINDLSPLSPLFSNQDILKIFHASEYDLICLKRDFGFEINHIFDTMIAARILGELQVGLGSLIKSKFNIDLDKRFQRANWGTRPLTQAMLDYARMDTHYLFALHSLLDSMLAEKGLTELAREDFELACQVVPPTNVSNGYNCWKVAKGEHIDPETASILQALCNYREREAMRIDLPRFKVLSDAVLLEISHHPPQTNADLENIAGLSAILRKRHGAGILSAVASGTHYLPPKKYPAAKPDNAFLQRLEALRAWRKTRAKELEIESDVVLPRENMEKIATQNPRTLKELERTMYGIPWRFRIYGKSILKTLMKLEKK